MRSAGVMLMLLLLPLLAEASGYSTYDHDTPTDLQRLVKDLKERNPDRTRPVEHNAQNVTVYISIAPKRTHVDDQRQEMTLEAWTFLSWNDAFLSWYPSQFGGTDRVHLDAGDLWLPDIAAFNKVLDGDPDIFENVPVLVMSSGSVMWFPPTRVTVPCSLNLQSWPSDKHNCTIEFGSWTHHGEQIDLRILSNTSGILLENYKQGNEWQLLNTTGERRQQAEAGTMHFDVQFSFLLQRLATDHAGYISSSTIVVLVCVVASYVLPVSHFLPRLLLHLFSLAVLIACELILYSSLPSTSGPMPHVVKSYNGCLVLTTLSLLCSLWLHWLTRSTRPGLSFLDIVRSKTSGVVRYNHLQESNTEPDVTGQSKTQRGESGTNDRIKNSPETAIIVNIGDSVEPPLSTRLAPTRDLFSNIQVDEPTTATSHEIQNETASPPATISNTSNALNQLKAARLEHDRKMRIKVINIIAAGLFGVAFLINYIVLRQYLSH